MCHNDKEVNHQENITILNIHIPNSSFKILKAKIERTTKRNGHILLIVRNFGTLLSVIDQGCRKKINSGIYRWLEHHY